MKIEILTCELNAMLKNVTVAIDTRGILRWARGVYLKAEGNRLTAMANNGVQTIVQEMDCEVLKEGTALLDGKLLLEVASKLPDGTCMIDSSDGKNATLKVKSNKTRMTSLDEKTFVFPLEIKETAAIRAPGDEWCSAFKKVLYAVAELDTHQRLTGVNLKVRGTQVTMCGMDGYRMGISKLFATISGEEADITIPKKAVADMVSIFGRSDDEVTLATDGKHIRVSNGKVTMQCQLLAGEYPNYKQVVTKTPITTSVLLDAYQFRDAVKRAMVMRDGRNNLLKLMVDKDGMTITSNNEAGDMMEKLECDVSGDGMEIAFNGLFLCEALSAITEKEVVLKLSSPASPAMISLNEKSSWLHCVLPVRMVKSNDV